MGRAPAQRLIADVGGTRARFALSERPGHLGRCIELSSREQPPAALVRRALEALAPAGAVTEARLAVAGPVEGATAQLTNLPWRFDAAEIAAETALERVRLVNDFAAVAHALPLLRPDDRRLVAGPTEGRSRATLAVLGPGTGLGLAAAVPEGADAWTVMAGEGGHVTLPARDAAEWAILQALGERLGHVSAERLCSGPGLEALYAVLDEPAGASDRAPLAEAPDAEEGDPELREAATLAAADIGEAARRGEPRARACLRHFADFLGTVASDAVLTLGATGGLFLAGGVLPRLGEAFDWRRFHRRFLDKGRFGEYLAAVPVQLLTHPQPGLLGLTAERLQGGSD